MFGVWHRAFPSVFVGETVRSCPPLLGLLTIDKGIPLHSSSRLIHLAPKLSVHARNIQQYTQHTCLCFIIPTKRAFFEFLWCVPYNSLSQGATGPKASFERMSKENQPVLCCYLNMTVAGRHNVNLSTLPTIDKANSSLHKKAARKRLRDTMYLKRQSYRG